MQTLNITNEMAATVEYYYLFLRLVECLSQISTSARPIVSFPILELHLPHIFRNMAMCVNFPI